MTTTTTATPPAGTTGELGSAAARGPSIARSLSRLASWRVWLASAAVFVVFAGALFVSSAPFSIPEVDRACGQTVLDMRFGSSADDVAAFLDRCGPAGREAYRDMQVADLFYPAVVAVFLASSLALVISRLFPHRPSMVGLAAIPLVASGFDYLENLFAWLALRAYPQPASTDGLLGLASTAKSITSWAASLLLLAGVAALVARTGWRRATPARHPS